MNKPRVLLLGGIDPSGGAGLTLDARAVSAHGAHALPVPMVLTAQNRHGFRDASVVPAAQWTAAFEAACEDGEVDAVKVGMLGDAATVAAVATALRTSAVRAPVVVDPVLSATAGGFDGAADVVDAYREHLVPLADLVTPNRPECEALFGAEPGAALRAGARAVLVKGGHGAGAEAEDVLHEDGGEQAFVRPRLDVGPVRGTGCALASAVAARLAAGASRAAACREAGDWLALLLGQLGPPPADGLPRVLPL